MALVEPGPFGIARWGPTTSSNLAGFDPVTHAVFWSMLGTSACSWASPVRASGRLEQLQAALFVTCTHPVADAEDARSGTARRA